MDPRGSEVTKERCWIYAWFMKYGHTPTTQAFLELYVVSMRVRSKIYTI